MTPGARLRLPRTTLKWYEIRRPDALMPMGLEDETRAFVCAEVEAGRLDVEGQPGWYKCSMKVRPHFKYMGASFELSLVGKLDKE